MTFSTHGGDGDEDEDDDMLVSTEPDGLGLMGSRLYHSLSSPENSDIDSVGFDEDLLDQERRPHTVAYSHGHPGTHAVQGHQQQAWGFGQQRSGARDTHGAEALVPTSPLGSKNSGQGTFRRLGRRGSGVVSRGSASERDPLSSDGGTDCNSGSGDVHRPGFGGDTSRSNPDLEGSVMIEGGGGSIFSDDGFHLNLDSSLGDDFLSLFAGGGGT